MNNDLISRSALLEKSFSTAPATMINPYGGASGVRVEDIENAPAVDAETVLKDVGLVKKALEMAHADLVPVVRCRDCQYATWAIWAQRYNCEKVRGLMTADNHFCAWGKRREDK